jgi:hypothetical protein
VLLGVFPLVARKIVDGPLQKRKVYARWKAVRPPRLTATSW